MQTALTVVFVVFFLLGLIKACVWIQLLGLFIWAQVSERFRKPNDRPCSSGTD